MRPPATNCQSQPRAHFVYNSRILPHIHSMLTHQKHADISKLDNDFVHNLNDYFGKLCHDENYIKPTPMKIPENEEVPQLSEFL